MKKTLLEIHADKIEALTPEQREVFEERAAIKEYCGNIFRLKAEIEALREVENGRKI
jgi:hypothetical protein